MTGIHSLRSGIPLWGKQRVHDQLVSRSVLYTNQYHLEGYTWMMNDSQWDKTAGGNKEEDEWIRTMRSSSVRKDSIFIHS
jgi:hypothetical protein